MRRAVAGGLIVLSIAVAACATVSRVEPSRLSLDEKIGQLFVFAARGVFVNEGSPEWRELLRQVHENRVGGILWYGSNGDLFETAWLNSRLQAEAKIPLLISADLEAGVGMRFAHTTWWPWPMAVAATGDPSLAERQGRTVGEEARAIGLNQIEAPVADVNLDPDNPDINTRSYGDDPEEVARFVAAFVRGVQSAGVVATAKHFPGHGDTATDSHRSLPRLAVSRDRLERIELVPFRAAISAGVRAILTGHLSIPSLDDTPAPPRSRGPRRNPYVRGETEVAQDATVPASLSPAITEGLLRRDLRFEGLVLTDAADMGALTDHFEPGEIAVRAVLAGADQIPKSPDTDAGIAAIRGAVESGRIPRERLDASLRRILAVKAWAGAPLPRLEDVFRIVDRPDHRALAREIAQRSITLVREESGVLPLGRGIRLLHVLVTEAGERIGGDLERELSDRLDDRVETVGIDARSDEAELAELVEKARGRDAVLVSLFLRVQSGRGTLALAPAAKSAVERLLAAGTPVIAVSFGTPYLLRNLPGLSTYLVAWGVQTDAQVAAARAVFGEAEISGRLPVSIGDLAPRGAGIVHPAAAGSSPR